MRNTQNNRNNNPRSKLIFALDVRGDLREALDWVDRLKNHVGLFKVGKEAFTRFGPNLIREIQARGANIFLDLKFHDIPNTVARASEAACSLGVSMFNVHALGGRDMMRAAVKAVQQAAPGPEGSLPALLAVTVLTSLNDSDLSVLGFPFTTAEMVMRLAILARDSGVSGVVASARDIAAIRRSCGYEFLIVTPGIRGPLEIVGDDQKRVWTAHEAIRDGADFLVIGRPIQAAEDPVAEAEKFIREIDDGLKARPHERVVLGSA